MVRLARWDVAASTLAVELRRGPRQPGHGPLRGARAGPGLLAGAVGPRHRRGVRRARPGHLAGRGARRDGAGDLPADRRIVRGVRADRVAPAARQPQRAADGRGRCRLLRLGHHRPVRPAARADRGDRPAGALGAVLRRAAADAADRRTARVARRLAAGGRLRACSVGPAGGLAAVLRAGRQPAGRLPERRHRRRRRQGPALAGGPCLRRGRGRGRPAMEGGVPTAPAGAAAERRRQRRAAALRRAADQRHRDRLALADRPVAGDLLARERAGGLPRRPAALAAGPRGPGRPLPRPQDHPRDRAAGGARQDAGRPEPRGRLPTAQVPGLCRRRRAPGAGSPDRPRSLRRDRRERRHRARRAGLRRLARRRSGARRGGPRRSGHGARERAPARRGRSHGSRRSRPRASASSRPATPSAGAWSATCTTARSSGSSRSRCSCASWRGAWATTRRRRP